MNPYEILDVDKTATDAEIKKAYRKLAAKHHPDKGGDEDRFKQISEAYSTIESAEKRREYDARHYGGGFGDLFGGFGDLFEGFFGSRSHRHEARELSDEEIVFDFKISLAQIKKGLSQNIVFNRDKKCTSCDGIGGKNKKTCQSCSGRGFHMTRIGPMIQQVTCNECFGSGFSFEEKCQVCTGTGTVQVRETINFTIKNK